MTFLNGGYWPWLGAIGLPLLIHLLTRRVRKETLLPTFRLLEQALARQKPTFRLRHRLLLLLRTLLILCLVLAFLKPTLTAPLAIPTTGKRAVVVVLDRSLSLGATQGGVSRLAKARGTVLAYLDDLRAGDVANVLLAGATPEPVLARPSGDFGTLRQALRSVSVNAERGEMVSAIAAAHEQLMQTTAVQKELVIASDFQRTHWAEVKFDAIPAEIRLVYLDVGENTLPNTALTGLRLRPTPPRAGAEATLEAEVWNGSSQAQTLTVSAQREGAGGELTPVTVQAPPFATSIATFPIVLPAPGQYRITAQLPADGLPADDRRFLVADLRHRQTVLLLTDANLQNPRTGAYYLTRALNPTPQQPGGVRVLTKPPALLSEADLASTDAVLLCEAETFPADKMPLLARYLTQGGSLLVFLTGERIAGQMAALARLAPEGDGLPYPLHAPMDLRGRGKGYLTLSEARYESPLLRLFREGTGNALGQIHIYRFLLTGEAAPSSEVLLKFEDATPAVARRNFGAGSVLFCNLSPSPNDTDLARQPLFPPLLHEFLKGLTTKEEGQHEFFPGGVASTTIDFVSAKKSVRVVAPNGEAEPATVDRVSGGVIVERVTMPGFHRVLAEGQEVGLIAVNPSPDESDLRPIAPRTLEALSKRRSGLTVGANLPASDLAALRQGRALWPYCLLMALLLLTLEQYLATYGSVAKARQ